MVRSTSEARCLTLALNMLGETQKLGVYASSRSYVRCLALFWVANLGCRILNHMQITSARVENEDLVKADALHILARC